MCLLVGLVLTYWSAIYYKERMLFVDASHIAFDAINSEQLQIQQYRFGAFITQMVPVIGSKLHLPIKHILAAYSLSFQLFYMAVTLMLFFWFRNYSLVILFTFYQVLVAAYGYFWTNNEVHQGICWMMLLFGSLLYVGGATRGRFGLSIGLVVLLGTTAIFCHPLVVFPLFFLWIYWLLEPGGLARFTNSQKGIITCLFVLIAASKAYVSARYSGYDQNLVSNVHVNHIFSCFNKPIAIETWKHVFSNYTLAPIIGLAGAVGLAVRKRWAQLALMLAAFSVYIVLLFQAFDGYLEFYTESELMPGVIILTAAFVYAVVPRINKWAVVSLLLFVCYGRLRKIHDAVGQFRARYEHIFHVLWQMQQQGIDRMVLVKPDNSVAWTYMIEWGFPTETLLASAWMGQQPQRQFLVVGPEQQ